MINLGLENLFREKDFEDPKRKPMNIKTLGNGFQNLVLGPPRIIIETLDDNHTNIFYRIHLRSGLFKTAVDGPNGEGPQSADLASVSYVVNHWYSTFIVDLGKISFYSLGRTEQSNACTAQTVLKDDDPRKGDALKKLMRLQGKYTVQQLMVNMKSNSGTLLSQTNRAETGPKLPKSTARNPPRLLSACGLRTMSTWIVMTRRSISTRSDPASDEIGKLSPSQSRRSLTTSSPRSSSN